MVFHRPSVPAAGPGGRALRAAAAALLLLSLACASPGPSAPHAGDDPPPPPPPGPNATWDVDSLGLPRFVATDYIDLARIAQVSRFRSGYGHDYSDEREDCRSMKHYFAPADPPSAATIPIVSPVAGVVTRLIDEWAGTQVQIESASHPAFTIVLFHVSLATPLAVGDTLAEGQSLGTHIGGQTSSDVAVRVITPHDYRYISWFDVMTDGLFASYAARGATSRAQFIIPAAERDADPLQCDANGGFAGPGTIENWVILP